MFKNNLVNGGLTYLTYHTVQIIFTGREHFLKNFNGRTTKNKQILKILHNLQPRLLLFLLKYQNNGGLILMKNVCKLRFFSKILLFNKIKESTFYSDDQPLKQRFVRRLDYFTNLKTFTFQGSDLE